ncbi:MAG: ABC transporter permease [Actinomycetota bacterium]|nr:ABC transporter permease [Actinomycetota bacterium]MDQ2955548.1 ABC transporter permease [Actinomycetota bacterium]
MIAFLLRRLLALAATLLASSFAIFGMLYLAPGSPIAFLSGGHQLSPQALAALQHRYGLDRPFLVRYWDWLVGSLHGDFGRSIAYNTSVGRLLAPRIVTTLGLVAYSSVLIIVAGVALGLISGLRGGATQLIIAGATTIGIAVPSFLASIVLITVFAVNLGWFPVFGPGTGFLDGLWHLTLPAIALALAGTAYVARLSRAAIAEELARDHVRTARGRGLPAGHVIRRHVVRNAMVPISTVAGLTVAGLIAGVAIIETAFGLSGIGSFLVESVTSKDFPVVQAIALILVTAFVVVNTIVDMLYSVLDPRIALGARTTA